MAWQTLIATLLVGACAGYTLWSMMPASWRRRLDAWRGKPVVATVAGCGGCDGCGGAKATPARAPGEAVIRIVRARP